MHGAVPPTVEAMGTVLLVGPEATDWAAAGAEAGPGGDDQMLEDSGAALD